MIKQKFEYCQGNSFSDLFDQNLKEIPAAFILNYPATDSWAADPNTQKYFLQDSSHEATQIRDDKVCQKEP